MADTRRMKWSRNGDRMQVSLRDTTGYVMLITFPADQWPPEGDQGEILDEETDDEDQVPPLLS